jgi:hypothetical protein
MHVGPASPSSYSYSTALCLALCLLAFVPMAPCMQPLTSNWPAWIPVSSRRYPKDSDKIMLAKQTGLTRSQVSEYNCQRHFFLSSPAYQFDCFTGGV